MNNEPLVSILIISYNQIQFIKETLTSALNQEYTNLEVIIADDGSTDGTVELIADFGRQYPDRLKTYLYTDNVGITRNCNRALENCKGKYIAFQGGDDILLPGKIRKQVDWMEVNENRVLCGHNVEIFEWPSGHFLSLWSHRIPLRSGTGPQLVIRYGSPFTATAIMIRASKIPSYGFDERISLSSDWKLWIDCLSDGGEFGYIEGVFARYRRHINNVTSVAHGSEISIKAFLTDALLITSIVEVEHPEWHGLCKTVRAMHTFSCGYSYLLRGDSKNAQRYLWNSIRYNPFFSWKIYVALILSILPTQTIQPILFKLSNKRGLT